MIKGLIVRPGKKPEVIEFEKGYRNLQKLVEGNFEMPYIFDDVDIVINEEGKLNGSLPNKYIYYDNRLVDILFGNILIVGSDEEGETVSLSEDKIRKYTEILASDRIVLS